MRQRLRSHLTYANVIVTILALFVVLGGTTLCRDGRQLHPRPVQHRRRRRRSFPRRPPTRQVPSR